MIQYSMVDSLILLDARQEVGVIGGVIRVSQVGIVPGSQRGGVKEKRLEPQGAQRGTGENTGETLNARCRFRNRQNLSSAGKKCGAESGDPNLRFQPRLPGSVVGEASMGQVEKADKITGVTVLRQPAIAM